MPHKTYAMTLLCLLLLTPVAVAEDPTDGTDDSDQPLDVARAVTCVDADPWSSPPRIYVRPNCL